MNNRFYKIIHNKYSKIFRFIFFLRYLFAIFLTSIALFLITPNFFDYEKRKVAIKSHILNSYNLNVDEYEKIQYRIFPLPNLEIKRATIKVKSSSSRLNVKNLIIYPKFFSIYNYDNFETSKLILKDNSVILQPSDLKFFINFFLNQKKKFLIKNLKISFKEKDNFIAKLENINFSNYGYNHNLIKGKIFGKKFSAKISDNLKIIDFRLLKSGIKTEINLIDTKKENELKGVFKSRILNTKIKFDFYYDEKNLKIYNSYFRNNDLTFNNESIVFFKPFFDIDLKFNINNINTKIFQKIDVNKIVELKNIIRKINSNTEIKFKSKRLNQNFIDDFYLKIESAYGRVNYSKKFSISQNFFECKGDINFLEEYPLLFFDCLINLEEKQELFKELSIKTNNKKEKIKLKVKGKLNILANKINFNEISTNENYTASKEDLMYFKEIFQNLIFDETFIKIFNLKKFKKFILEIS